jgi:tetratricopeptide (TPR) repeat protein
MIGLRCLLYALPALFICLSFVRRYENRTELLLSLFLVASSALVIMNRELVVRPHLFSYLFIVAFSTFWSSSGIKSGSCHFWGSSGPMSTGSNMGQTAKNEKVYWNLHAAYAKSKEYKKAYRVLAKYVNPFSPNEDYKEIYQLGVSAATIGNIREAFIFLKIARMRAPRTDTEYIQKIERNLAILSGDVK